MEANDPMVHKKEFAIMDVSRRDRLKPSIKDPPVLELKELPIHLNYAFLGEGVTLPVIITSNLKKDQKEKLLHVLCKHKKAIVTRANGILK